MLFFQRFYDILSITLKLVAFSLYIVPYVSKEVVAEDGGFELPIQLVGFPVIILAVRMSNFVRKLAYSLNPNTYRRNVRKIRGIYAAEPPINLAKADKELLQQLGPNFCVYSDVCLEHARNAGTKNANDWGEIIKIDEAMPTFYRNWSNLPLNIHNDDLLPLNIKRYTKNTNNL